MTTIFKAKLRTNIGIIVCTKLRRLCQGVTNNKLSVFTCNGHYCNQTTQQGIVGTIKNTREHLKYSKILDFQGQKKIAIILPKNRDTAIFNRIYIRLYIKFVANNGKNRDSAHAAISFCPC